MRALGTHFMGSWWTDLQGLGDDKLRISCGVFGMTPGRAFPTGPVRLTTAAKLCPSLALAMSAPSPSFPQYHRPDDTRVPGGQHSGVAGPANPTGKSSAGGRCRPSTSLLPLGAVGVLHPGDGLLAALETVEDFATGFGRPAYRANSRPARSPAHPLQRRTRWPRSCVAPPRLRSSPAPRQGT